MNDSLASTPPTAAPPTVGALPMFRAVVGVGILCALAIVTVYELTGPVIRENRRAMLERAVTQVLPGATESVAFRLNDSGQFEPAPEGSSDDDLVYAGYDPDRNLVGMALVGSGMGYQDVIRLLYGYSFEKETVLGISVLESRETPGLGDRIESDPNFLANFGTLDVRLDAAQSAPAHPIEFVKPGEKTQPWQIDGISGATVTSKATATILRDSTARWIPLLRPRRDDFLHPERVD